MSAPHDKPFVEPIRPVRTFEAAIEHILEGVQRARLRPGDRLPSAPVLARQLGISTPTLRQSIRVLQRSGFVDVRPGNGGGVFIKSELVPHDALVSQIEIEAEEVADILIGRRLLETTATQRAVAVGTPEDFDELDRAGALMEENIGTRSGVMRADVMFHHAIARATHNRTVEKAMRQIIGAMAPIRDSYVSDVANDQANVDLHRRQAEVMRAADYEALHVVLDAHFRIAEEAFARAMDRSWESMFRLGERSAPSVPSTTPGAVRQRV